MNLRDWTIHDWLLAVGVVVIFACVTVVGVVMLLNVTADIHSNGPTLTR